MPYLNADLQREYQRKWMARRRQDWIASQGGACAKCGSDDRLEVDHIDPALKSLTPALLWSRAKAFRDAELAKCQVLCYTCHKSKTLDQTQVREHGRHAMYRRGCRCRVCKDGMAASKRAYRARKKAEAEAA